MHTCHPAPAGPHVPADSLDRGQGHEWTLPQNLVLSGKETSDLKGWRPELSIFFHFFLKLIYRGVTKKEPSNGLGQVFHRDPPEQVPSCLSFFVRQWLLTFQLGQLSLGGTLIPRPHPPRTTAQTRGREHRSLVSDIWKHGHRITAMAVYFMWIALHQITQHEWLWVWLKVCMCEKEQPLGI